MGMRFKTREETRTITFLRRGNKSENRETKRIIFNVVLFTLPGLAFILPIPLVTQVHSFDLVSRNPRVIACDMAHVPLQDASVNIVVFCLSLMGTNLADFLREAHRVLVRGGIVKVGGKS